MTDRTELLVVLGLFTVLGVAQLALLWRAVMRGVRRG